MTFSLLALLANTALKYIIYLPKLVCIQSIFSNAVNQMDWISLNTSELRGKLGYIIEEKTFLLF